MNRTTAQLVAKGYRVLDLTQKSWFLNKKSVEALTNTLPAACIPAVYSPPFVEYSPPLVVYSPPLIVYSPPLVVYSPHPT